MAKRKRMTAREKKCKAEWKKRMQEEGILPPDKPKLNRKKYIEEAQEEWNGRDTECYVWDAYLMEAISIMLSRTERNSLRVSLEAVGVAKALKMALRLRQFYEKLKEEGRDRYKVYEQYEFIRDIFEA
ncbi:hypothetical protein FMM74_016215 [Lachnospiraceae bacterium MD308]|nr:hypothetical protein [Lachnospiraceae bacterium MD308]